MTRELKKLLTLPARVATKDYIDVVDGESGEVVKSVDVTGRPTRERDRVEDGMNINLDHSRYFTRRRMERA